MTEPVITLVGNLTDDPELRTVDSDTVVAHFTVASTPRLFDRKTHEWRDGETLFLRCSLWRHAAENVAASLKKGTRVIVTGRLQQRSFTNSDGDPQRAVELEVDEIGPSLRYATAAVTKTSRANGEKARSPVSASSSS
jgi:single-strand DNA-binding protein